MEPCVVVLVGEYSLRNSEASAGSPGMAGTPVLWLSLFVSCSAGFRRAR
jgi:hypothetical protein